MNQHDQLDELRELLPWYENGTLRSDEHEAVHALLASDFETNRQRRELRALRAAVTDEPILAPNVALNLRRLHVRLDHTNSLRMHAPWLALAALIVLALGVATFFAGVRWGSYHTLTAVAEDAAPADADLLRVDVAAGVDAATLVQIAGDAQVRVLRGPSHYGVATLAVPHGQAAQVIARLSADPRLRFVTTVPRNE